MSDQTFMMGKYAAVLPGELRYSDNHMWCREVEGRLRFGFTSYAVRLMQDVYFLDWVVDADAGLARGPSAYLLAHAGGQVEDGRAPVVGAADLGEVDLPLG